MRRRLPLVLAALAVGALGIAIAASASLKKDDPARPPVSEPAVSERTVSHEVVIPAGSTLRVRVESRVGSDFSRVEDPVDGRLESAIVVDGRTVVPAGSRVTGVVTAATRSGEGSGRSLLALRFESLTVGQDGERYRIATRTWSVRGQGRTRKNALTIGVPAVGGAIVGGLIGGGKGAAIGAVAGGGAGTGVVLTSHGKEVQVGPGAVLLVRTTQPLTVRVG